MHIFFSLSTFRVHVSAAWKIDTLTDLAILVLTFLSELTADLNKDLRCISKNRTSRKILIFFYQSFQNVKHITYVSYYKNTFLHFTYNLTTKNIFINMVLKKEMAHIQ